jgi:hypothetical protein
VGPLQGLLSPLSQSLETNKELNPFENGLFRQSNAPALDPSIIYPESNQGLSHENKTVNPKQAF